MSAPQPVIQNIKGKDYEVVASRLARFRHDHPERGILTELVHHDDKRVIVKATVCDDNHLPIAVGHAEEYREQGMINKTSAIENCETSALGRALGILGYDACNSIASADEVSRAIGQQASFSSSAPAPQPPTPAPPPAGGGGGAAPPPAGHRLVELRKYFENETSKGKPYIKAFAKVDGTDMDVYVWDAHNHQIVKDNCPGVLHATGEYEEFRGKTRFKLANAETVEQAPPPKKESFDDSDIPF